MLSANPRFQGNIYIWPINRTVRTFRIFVVEPKEYCPELHKRIFNGAITSLLIPESDRIDPYSRFNEISSADNFDLITFPEAFLPQDALLDALRNIDRIESIGCVHVGIRPSESSEHHLFSVRQLKILLQSLHVITKIDKCDLNTFSEWLKKQNDSHHYNVGCVFTIDADHKIRVCLHPKIVRSKYEINTLNEKHMIEANLLTLVTLLPVDKNFLSITLQPLLCSDALHLDTDRPRCWPIDCVNSDASCFVGSPPDHIDIVSISACTPQQYRVSDDNVGYHTWHSEFRNTCIRSVKELSRHYHSTFVLSNYQSTKSSDIWGLSGIFIPVPLPNMDFPNYISLSSWGRFSDTDNRWSTPDDANVASKGKSSLCYVANINSDEINGHSPAHMLGFTLSRLIRDMTRLQPNHNIIDVQLYGVTDELKSNEYHFKKQDGSQ
jgi:hypothetical protein